MSPVKLFVWFVEVVVVLVVVFRGGRLVPMTGNGMATVTIGIGICVERGEEEDVEEA